MTFAAKGEKIKSTKALFRAVLLIAKLNTSNVQDCFKSGNSTSVNDKYVQRERTDKISLSHHIFRFCIMLTW